MFTLNKHRFPDFSDFCRQFHLAGLRIVPNIKPYVITTHPDYESLASNGALFYDPSLGTVVTTKIWALGIGDMLAGSWVDASSQAGYDWWCKGASELIDMGADGLWKCAEKLGLTQYLANISSAITTNTLCMTMLMKQPGSWQAFRGKEGPANKLAWPVEHLLRSVSLRHRIKPSN